MLDGNKYELNDYTDLPLKHVATSVAAVGATGTSNSSANSNYMIIDISSNNFYGLSDIVAKSGSIEKYGYQKCDQDY